MITVQINHSDKFEKNNFVEKHYLKRKTTARSREKTQIFQKRRSLPIKIFAKAHLTNSNQTFLNETSHKLKKKNPQQMKNKNYKHFHSREKNIYKDQKVKKEVHQPLKETRKTSDIIEGLDQQQFHDFITKVQKSGIKKETLTKQTIIELTKVFYGEECACWQDKSFKLIDQSTIRLKDDGNFLGVGQNLKRCSISIFNQVFNNQKR